MVYGMLPGLARSGKRKPVPASSRQRDRECGDDRLAFDALQSRRSRALPFPRAVTQQVHECLITINPAALPARYFNDDAKALKFGKSAVDGRRGQSRLRAHFWGGQEGTGLHQFVDSQD